MSVPTILSPADENGPSGPLSTDSIAADYLALQDNSNAAQAGKLLLGHMLEAVRNAGFDDTALQKIAALVAANLAFASCSSENSSDMQLVAGTVVDALLSDRNLHVNSNEPVLLISVSEELIRSPEQVRKLRQGLFYELRSRNVKPIRVYVRLGQDTDATSVDVFLLNVVNTDIGGPGMIQLLDSAFHDESWKHDLLSKEAWHETELLWRDENWPSSSSDVYVSVQEREKSMNAHPEASASVDQSTTKSEADPDKNTSEPSKDDHTSNEPTEHPEMRALTEKDASRPYVQHPTWSRDHENQTLLDIIKSQSSSVASTGPISVIGRASSGGKEMQPSQSGEEDFELVEQP